MIRNLTTRYRLDDPERPQAKEINVSDEPYSSIRDQVTETVLRAFDQGAQLGFDLALAANQATRSKEEFAEVIRKARADHEAKMKRAIAGDET